ncbi:hypothetical protein D3C72_1519750 [compost metagenome]
MKQLAFAWVGAVLVLAGCNQPRTAEEAGGGGGQPAGVPNVQQTRDNLGDAYVQAARTHADVIRGDHAGAKSAIRAVRNELADAKRTASLDTQARINEVDLEAIRVQRQIDQRALNTHQETEKLVGSLEGLFSAAAPPAKPAGGGAGMAPAAPSAPPDKWEVLPPQPAAGTTPPQRLP